MKSKIQKLMDEINEKADVLKEKKATIGFDGFIDSISKVLKTKRNKEEYSFFEDLSEFGSYISNKNGKSCTMELKEQIKKMGGNIPIMSIALKLLGVNVNCVGAMGYPVIRREFSHWLKRAVMSIV